MCYNANYWCTIIIIEVVKEGKVHPIVTCTHKAMQQARNCFIMREDIATEKGNSGILKGNLLIVFQLRDKDL